MIIFSVNFFILIIVMIFNFLITFVIIIKLTQIRKVRIFNGIISL